MTSATLPPMHERSINAARIERLVITAILLLFLIAALIFVGDWIIWRTKLAHGTGMNSVHVTRTVVAPLKGNKEEYYPDGAADVACSRSLFSQAGAQACWWLERHREVIDR